jgi:hypothetical protein
MNLVALTGLLEWLRARAVARPASPDSEPVPRPSPGGSEASERLPPLLAPGDMDEVTRTMVLDLNTFGERGDGHVLVSMY